MSKRRLLLAALLLFADGWVALTIATAVTSGEGHGGVFWTAIALLTVLLAGLLLATRWVLRGVRRR